MTPMKREEAATSSSLTSLLDGGEGVDVGGPVGDTVVFTVIVDVEELEGDGATDGVGGVAVVVDLHMAAQVLLYLH